ncbi:8-demethyl-8-aminoriboflavin-5'-phosphate synthase [Streptomyces glaucescens]
MDAMLSETDQPTRRPVAYNRVAGVVVTGNEDGAHHVISEINGALCDIGYTIPGQSWTYWHLAPALAPTTSTINAVTSGPTDRPRHGRQPVKAPHRPWPRVPWALRLK